MRTLSDSQLVNIDGGIEKGTICGFMVGAMIGSWRSAALPAICPSNGTRSCCSETRMPESPSYEVAPTHYS